MKSPTSLIRIRYAVGAMLALSAIFAVVISSVTLTQERPIVEAQSTPPPPVPVSLSTQNDQRIYAEGANVDVDVSLPVGKTAPTGGVLIYINVTNGTAMKGSDFTLRPENAAADVTSVTIESGTRSKRYTIVGVDTPDANDNRNVDEPQETFTVSLGTLPTGYTEGTTSSITFMIDDGDNEPATPATGMKITIPGTGSDASSSPADNGLVGQELTADVSGITDADYPRDGEGEVTGKSLSEIVKTKGTLTYQWIRILGTRDTADGRLASDPNDVMLGTEKTYTPVEADVSYALTVEATWSDEWGNGDATPEPLTASNTLAATIYDDIKPFIVKGATRLEPGVVLTANDSGLRAGVGDHNQDTSDNDALRNSNGIGYVDKDLRTDAIDPLTNVAADITLTWTRDGEAIDECSSGGNQPETRDPNTDIHDCTGGTYTLTDDDVASIITLVATYQQTPKTGTAGPVEHSASDPAGTVYSSNLATGKPEISGDAQLAATLTASKGTIADADGIKNDAVFTYEWFHGDDMKMTTPLPDGKGATYVVGANDANKTLKVRAKFKDSLGDTEMRTSSPTLTILGSPGMVSKVEPAIRSATVSAGDVVTLSVNMYGLQNAMDNGLGGTFSWSEGSTSLSGSGHEISYTAPSSPGTYTVKATLSINDCAPKDESMRDTACTAEFVVKVRRPSAAPDPDPAPVNPPGDIPGILADASGNQYEVFTPEGGGTFTGEGYTLSAAAGAVPNGEFIGIRMSDEGAASNAGMTHQRYTLGGNMYAVSAVDAGGASINSYVLDDPATVCVPLPDELRTDISELALLTINSDGSLTVLSAQVRISDAGTMVCGNLSGLPASVAVGSAGAPAAIPTATPEPTPEPPDTGGTAPSSSTLPLWSLLLGIAVLGLGSALVIGRRREWGAKG